MMKMKNSKQCISLQGTAVDFLPTSFSATDQLSLLSGMDTPAKSSENELPMDGSPACECGKGTFDCLIHPSTPEAWTAFMRDSLAKTLALLESRQVYLREPDQVFTAKSSASLAWYDQDSCSWKTYQQSLVTGWEPYSETWPRWGMTVGGSAFVHPMSERRITETGGSHWLPTPTATANQMAPSMQKHQGCRNLMFPTPTTIDAGTGRFNTSIGGKPRPSLALMARKNLWPTPTAHNAKETGAPSQLERKTVQLVDLASGLLNPSWVEWLMGFPIGFSASKDWATRKSRSKQQLLTGCLGDYDAP